MNLLLQEALKYARRGWAVVPDHSVTDDGRCTCNDLLCKVQGKHPRIERDSEDEYLRREGSINPVQIEEWWTKWPDSNIAICAGAASNLVIIDIDPRNDGFESLARLERSYSQLSNTVSCKSGGDGLHLYFLHPQIEVVRNRIGLYPGIDVKADGGRIVAPPSKHKSGNTYEWSSPLEITPIKPLPDWLFQMIQTQKGSGTWQAMRKQKNSRTLYE